MDKNAVNPFSVSVGSAPQRGAFSNFAELRRRGFLFRVIDVREPFVGRLTYSGWWFRQTVEIDGQSHWFQISWLKIHSHLEFMLPAWIAIDPTWGDGENRRVSIEINFSRSLAIRRFRIWVAGRILYDEIG